MNMYMRLHLMGFKVLLFAFIEFPCVASLSFLRAEGLGPHGGMLDGYGGAQKVQRPFTMYVFMYCGPL